VAKLTVMPARVEHIELITRLENKVCTTPPADSPPRLKRIPTLMPAPARVEHIEPTTRLENEDCDEGDTLAGPRGIALGAALGSVLWVTVIWLARTWT